jgi:hypothetical protein
MRKIVIGLFFAIFSVNSHAVLCEIITKDPRYNVASYFRNQTACRTTNYANATSIGSQIARVGTLFLVISALEYISRKNFDSKVESILSNNYKTVQCSFPYKGKQYVEFLVGDEYAILKGSEASFAKKDSGVYEIGNFSSYKLDMNKMNFLGNGLNGNINAGCYVQQEVRNGEVGNEFLITVEWEDKNKDTFKVFTQGLTQAIDIVKVRFKESHTKAESIYFDIKVNPLDAIEFQ